MIFFISRDGFVRPTGREFTGKERLRADTRVPANAVTPQNKPSPAIPHEQGDVKGVG